MEIRTIKGVCRHCGIRNVYSGSGSSARNPGRGQHADTATRNRSGGQIVHPRAAQCDSDRTGEKLLERARHILLEHDAALEEIAELTGARGGRLRIGSASAESQRIYCPGS